MNSNNKKKLALPARETLKDLSAEELAQVTGGRGTISVSVSIQQPKRTNEDPTCGLT